MKEMLKDIFPPEEWWKNDKHKFMTFLYWRKGQLPPSDKVIYEEEWHKLVLQMREKYGDGT